MEQTFEDLEKEIRKIGYPPVLCKACVFEFDYGLGLKDGTVIYFKEARVIDPEWVKIMLDETVQPALSNQNKVYNFQCDKGLEIRVSEIAWIAVSPFGS